MATETKKEFHKGIGRRKTAIAQVRIFPNGKGEFVINGKPMNEYLPETNRQDVVKEPLQKLGLEGSVNISVVVVGGGKNGQTEAIRHGIARALVLMQPDNKKELKVEGFLTRDARKKERKKPGLRKARRAKQWRKR